MLVCLAIEYACRHLSKLPEFPYGTYIMPHSTDYGDMLYSYPRFAYFHSDRFFDPGIGGHFLYPAEAASFYKLIYLVGGAHSLRAFLAVTIVLVLTAAILFYRAIRRRGIKVVPAAAFVLVAVTCSYPLYFDLNRGNVEVLVWLTAGAGLWAFCTERSWMAAALFALAGGLKLYPLIYLGLFFSRRQTRQFLFGIAIFLLANVVSLWAITPHMEVAWKGIQSGLTEFATRYTLHRRYGEIGFDHSLVGVAKRMYTYMPPPLVFARQVRIYLLLGALGGVMLFVGRIRKLPLINQVLCLTVACILLPPTSYDYTLLHLYLPWAMLVLLVLSSWPNERVRIGGLTQIFVCLTILLSSQSEFIYHGERFGGQIKAAVLLSLLAFALWYRLPSEFDSAKFERRDSSEALVL